MDIVPDEVLIELGYEKYHINFVRKLMAAGVKREQICASICRAIRRSVAVNAKEEAIHYLQTEAVKIVNSIHDILSGKEEGETNTFDPSSVNIRQLGIRAPQYGTVK